MRMQICCLNVEPPIHMTLQLAVKNWVQSRSAHGVAFVVWDSWIAIKASFELTAIWACPKILTRCSIKLIWNFVLAVRLKVASNFFMSRLELSVDDGYLHECNFRLLDYSIVTELWWKKSRCGAWTSSWHAVCRQWNEVALLQIHTLIWCFWWMIVEGPRICLSEKIILVWPCPSLLHLLAFS